MVKWKCDQPFQRRGFFCIFNIPWTNFVCQWIWKKTFRNITSIALVNTAVNRLDDSIFDDAYPGGGRDSYHPKMLTKVIIFTYTQRIVSSRQIAKAVRENIPFMWLAGRQRPDFRTLNRFRSQRMRNVLETVFTAVLQFLADKKYVSLGHYFVDGKWQSTKKNRSSRERTSPSSVNLTR
nr:transposase [Paenibacillus sp. FSL P4-0081]